MAMAQAAIADVVSPRERGRYQGYMASAWGVASIAGPVVGGYVTDHLSWRWIFWINLPIAVVAMILCNRALKLLRVRRVATRIDYLGAALLTGGVACWLVALSSGGTDIAWASPQAAGLALGGRARCEREHFEADVFEPHRLRRDREDRAVRGRGGGAGNQQLGHGAFRY